MEAKEGKSEFKFPSPEEFDEMERRSRRDSRLSSDLSEDIVDESLLEEVDEDLICSICLDVLFMPLCT